MERTGAKRSLGVIGAGILSGRGAVESGHAVTVFALSGVDHHLSAADHAPFQPRVRVLFAEQSSAALPGLIEGRAEDCPVIGTVVPPLKSKRPAVFIDASPSMESACALSLRGGFTFDAVVSHGCAACGPNLVITRAVEDRVLELGGRPAAEVVLEQIQSLPEGVRRHAADGIFLGRLLNAYSNVQGRADYLLRQVVRVDAAEGSVHTTERFRVGQTVRVHVRDPITASNDLAMLLEAQRLKGHAEGALLFSSSGRGEAMYGVSAHELHVISRALAPPEAGEELAKAGRRLDPTSRARLPMSGVFGSGEIGPIGTMGAVNALLSQTSVLGVFRRA
jgi:small ligand-binding sensory domain FIST